MEGCGGKDGLEGGEKRGFVMLVACLDGGSPCMNTHTIVCHFNTREKECSFGDSEMCLHVAVKPSNKRFTEHESA